MPIEEIRTRLKSNDGPANRVYRTLESYFFNGYPRAFANETLVEEHVPVLHVLISMAERWAVAHEYGHGLAMGVAFDEAPNPRQAEEFYADTNATVLTVLSAWTLDHLPPESSLAGANFTLACLDILRRAYSVVTTGRAVRDPGNGSHPPNDVRAEQCIEVFRRFFKVRYLDGGRVSSLYLADRKQPDDENPFGDKQREGVYYFSKALFEIWPVVQERLTRQYINRRPLHSIWQ
jgi:hypothetical protein